MIKHIGLKGYSSSVMINSTYHVVHEHFEVDIDMMIIFYRNNNSWSIDTIDFGGIFNLYIDGVVASGEDTSKYFDFLEKIGVNWKSVCIQEVEKKIESLSEDDIEKMIKKPF